MTPTFEDIAADFAFIDDWDEKYRYLIDLGKRLEPLTDEERNERTKVRGCASQVWLVTGDDDGKLTIRGDSDAAIVSGLVAVMIALFGGRTRDEIQTLDTDAKLAELDLSDHITPQRSNGVASMIRRLKAEAA